MIKRADFFIQNTNKCILKIFKHYDSSKIIIVSLIDNLKKGAAGQAVQCFNLSNGFDESKGLINEIILIFYIYNFIHAVILTLILFQILKI